MSKNSESGISFGLGILGGILAGVTAGVLFAPQSGEKTREELKETIDEIKKNITIEDKYGEGHSVELIDKIKYKFESQISRINDAIKAAKLAKAKEEESSQIDY